MCSKSLTKTGWKDAEMFPGLETMYGTERKGRNSGCRDTKLLFGFARMNSFNSVI